MSAKISLPSEFFINNIPRCSLWLAPIDPSLAMSLTTAARIRQDHYLRKVPLVQGEGFARTSDVETLERLRKIVSSVTTYIKNHISSKYNGIQAGDLITIDEAQSYDISNLLYWNGNNAQTLFHYGNDFYGIVPTVIVDDTKFNPYYWQGFNIGYNISSRIRKNIITQLKTYPGQISAEIKYSVGGRLYEYRTTAYVNEALQDIENEKIPFIVESEGYAEEQVIFSTSPNGLYDYPFLNDVVAYQDYQALKRNTE